MYKIGYYISVAFTALTLFWLGLFKYTPTEANSIQWLVSNHFAMSWMMKTWTLQTVSNIIGTIEMLSALGMILALFLPKYQKILAIPSVVLFVVVVSFLFTTPGMFKQVDGMWVTEFFIFKDFVLLGVCMMIFGKNTITNE